MERVILRSRLAKLTLLWKISSSCFNLSSVERRTRTIRMMRSSSSHPVLTSGKRLWLSRAAQAQAQTTRTDVVAISSVVPVPHWNERRLTSTNYYASVGRLLISLRRSEKPILCDECTLRKSKRITAMPKCGCKRGYKRDKNEYLCHLVRHRYFSSSSSSSHHIHNLKFQTKLYLINTKGDKKTYITRAEYT